MARTRTREECVARFAQQAAKHARKTPGWYVERLAGRALAGEWLLVTDWRWPRRQFPGPTPTIWRADARHAGFVDVVHRRSFGPVRCVVTSPPYFGRRRNSDDDPGEMGAGSDVEYIRDLVAVGRRLREVGDERLVWWLNLGDTCSGSGGAGGDHYNAAGSKRWIPLYHQGAVSRPAGQWLNLPGRVAEALVADSWYLRSTVTWDKTRRKPSDLKHDKRPGESSERILMLTVSPPGGYTWHPERLVETGEVWRFPPGQPMAKGHSAPFPDELVARCLEATTDPGDLVLDPFAGSGTTGRVARAMNREAVLTDAYFGVPVAAGNPAA